MRIIIAAMVTGLLVLLAACDRKPTVDAEVHAATVRQAEELRVELEEMKERVRLLENQQQAEQKKKDDELAQQQAKLRAKLLAEQDEVLKEVQAERAYRQAQAQGQQPQPAQTQRKKINLESFKADLKWEYSGQRKRDVQKAFGNPPIVSDNGDFWTYPFPAEDQYGTTYNYLQFMFLNDKFESVYLKRK